MADVDAGASGVVHANVVKDVYRLLDVFHQVFVPHHVGFSHGVSVRHLVAVLHWNIFLHISSDSLSDSGNYFGFPGNRHK